MQTDQKTGCVVICCSTVHVHFFAGYCTSVSFNLPATVTATFTINTNKCETFNNNLLGVNIDWGKGYSSIGYNHPDAKSFIRNYKPVTIRFPQAVWANFYDYLSDGPRRPMI